MVVQASSSESSSYMFFRFNFKSALDEIWINRDACGSAPIR